jgi:hypothetical protein
MNNDAIVKLEIKLKENMRTWDDPDFSELETLPNFISLLTQLESKGLLPKSINLSDRDLDKFIINNTNVLFDFISFDRDFGGDEKELSISYSLPIKITYTQYLADKEFFNDNFYCSIKLN